MDPAIKNGDLIIYKPYKHNNEAIQKGLIVVAKHPKKSQFLIVKRIHQSRENQIELRGDNQNNSIDSRSFGLVNIGNIVGIVEEVIRSNPS